MKKRRMLSLVAMVALIAGCGTDNLKDLQGKLLLANSPEEQSGEISPEAVKSLENMVSEARPVINLKRGFVGATADAIKLDPEVIAARYDAATKEAKLKSTQSLSEFKVDGTVLGGVEDVTDEIAGVAVIVKASRLIYDGGKLDASIAGDQHAAKAAAYRYEAVRDQRALDMTLAWVNLQKYQRLNDLITNRLEVLDPLLVQLEKVATAGLGDISQVAAAQRTVSQIRVTQIDVAERLSQAEVEFTRYYGVLPSRNSFDPTIISRAMPEADGIKSLAMSAPGLLAEYQGYLAAEAYLTAAKLSEKPTIGFESKVQRPLGDSEYGSDESIGIVWRKDFFSGGELEAKVAEAEAVALAQASRVRSTFQEGRSVIEASLKLIDSLDVAVGLAQKNAQITGDEIKFLKQQLVIGGSTLDSVLTAEARLYDALAKEVSLEAERQSAQLRTLATLGLLSPIFDR